MPLNHPKTALWAVLQKEEGAVAASLAAAAAAAAVEGVEWIDSLLTRT